MEIVDRTCSLLRTTWFIVEMHSLSLWRCSSGMKLSCKKLVHDARSGWLRAKLFTLKRGVQWSRLKEEQQACATCHRGIWLNWNSWSNKWMKDNEGAPVDLKHSGCLNLNEGTRTSWWSKSRWWFLEEYCRESPGSGCPSHFRRERKCSRVPDRLGARSSQGGLWKKDEHGCGSLPRRFLR